MSRKHDPVLPPELPPDLRYWVDTDAVYKSDPPQTSVYIVPRNVAPFWTKALGSASEIGEPSQPKVCRLAKLAYKDYSERLRRRRLCESWDKWDGTPCSD